MKNKNAEENKRRVNEEEITNSFEQTSQNNFLRNDENRSTKRRQEKNAMD